MSVPRSYAYALMATWRDEQGRWSPPAVLPFSGRSRDFDATFSPDGHRLYFISDRAGQGASGADYDVWVVERSGRTWGAPARLPAPVNTTFDESHAVEVGGGSLYVASDRPGGFGATDIYRIPRTATGFGTPSNLGVGVNSEAAEMEVTVAPDESELVLSSWARPGGDGSNDLYWSRRVAGRWQPVTRLPAPINTSAREYSPSFTPDGQGLLFASERATRPRAIQGTPYAEMRGAWRTVSNGWGNIYLVDRWWSRGGR